jgi:FKBP-type peptidyl-prolyl cis-trans isomerase
MRTALPTRLAALACAGLLAVLLVGCGSENSDDDTATDSSSETTETPESSEAASDAPSEDATSAAPSEEGTAGSWEPKVEADGDTVTGLDFSGTTPSDKLEFKVLKEGDGPVVESGQTITANYWGQIPSETEPFDESYSSSPFEAPIGVGSLIPGWDQTIPGVPVGSRVIMSLPSDLGYGDAGSGPIPGGATLVFVIDVLDAK